VLLIQRDCGDPARLKLLPRFPNTLHFGFEPALQLLPMFAAQEVGTSQNRIPNAVLANIVRDGFCFVNSPAQYSKGVVELR
jgi:hypothetical protein